MTLGVSATQPRAFARKQLRRLADAPLDRLRFELDRRPRLGYQPLPWIGLLNAKRSAGAESRWAEIRALSEATGVTSCADIGSNVGYFVLNFALQGIPAVGVESDERFVRLFVYARRRLGLEHLAASCQMIVTTDTVALVPTADAMLFLSVWHHMVRAAGLDDATRITEALWARTGRVLFFETGEEEMPDRYGLPTFVKSSEEIREYLESTCPGGRAEVLGRHAAFDPDGRPTERTLFAVVRSR